MFITATKLLLLMVLLCVSMYTDKKYYKIKNQYLLIGLLLGIILNVLENGLYGFINTILGVLIPFCMLFILFAVKMLGAGDVKLIMAIGGIMGAIFIMKASIWICIVGVSIGFIKMVKEKNLKIRLDYLYAYVIKTIYKRKLNTYCDLTKQDKKSTIKLSYAIALGTIIHLVRGGLGGL